MKIELRVMRDDEGCPDCFFWQNDKCMMKRKQCADDETNKILMIWEQSYED